MNLTATEFILMYLHLMEKKPIKQKTVILTKPYPFLTSFNKFVCKYVPVYEYTPSSNFKTAIE